MALACTLLATPAPAAGILWGVNDSGLEMGNGRRANTDYAVPDPGPYLAHGVRLVRLPFTLDRLQPVPGGPLDAGYLATLRRIVAQDAAAGALTVLDPHGYGFFDAGGGSRDVAADVGARDGYVALMRRLGEAFAHDRVAIGLMNEPHTGADADYLPVWNRAIGALRQAGFAGTVLVPHAHWSSASDIGPQSPFPAGIRDGANNWVLELHSYFDPDNSGTYHEPVVSEDIGVARLRGAIAWSRQAGVRIFLGETGTPGDPAALRALARLLDAVAAAPDVFWGVALWGGGPWFGTGYPMRLDPVDGRSTPQFEALARAFGATRQGRAP